MSEHNIHDLGGLTASEIELRDLQAKVEMGKMLDEKLGQVTTAVNTRMDSHEGKVNTRLDDQDKKLNEVLSTVKSIERKGDDWHAEDLVYRRATETRLQRLEAVLRSLKLWVATLRAFGVIRKVTVTVVHEGKPFLLALGSICSFIILIIQFIHTVWPVYIHPWLLHFKH